MTHFATCPYCQQPFDQHDPAQEPCQVRARREEQERAAKHRPPSGNSWERGYVDVSRFIQNMRPLSDEEIAGLFLGPPVEIQITGTFEPSSPADRVRAILQHVIGQKLIDVTFNEPDEEPCACLMFENGAMLRFYKDRDHFELDLPAAHGPRQAGDDKSPENKER